MHVAFYCQSLAFQRYPDDTCHFPSSASHFHELALADTACIFLALQQLEMSIPEDHGHTRRLWRKETWTGAVSFLSLGEWIWKWLKHLTKLLLHSCPAARWPSPVTKALKYRPWRTCLSGWAQVRAGIWSACLTQWQQPGEWAVSTGPCTSCQGPLDGQWPGERIKALTYAMHLENGV